MLLGSQQTVWATQGAVFHVRITVCSLHQISLLKQETQNNQSGVVLPLSSSGFFSVYLFIHLCIHLFNKYWLIASLFIYSAYFPKESEAACEIKYDAKTGYPGIQTEKRKRLCHQLQRWLEFGPVCHRKRIVGCLEFYSLPNQNIQIMWRI